uniref:Uncharacterized protein n=1 Tax=Triticum urartu TaxID=4572 RepID=A0A8R7TU15_TRIUA
ERSPWVPVHSFERIFSFSRSPSNPTMAAPPSITHHHPWLSKKEKLGVAGSEAAASMSLPWPKRP